MLSKNMLGVPDLTNSKRTKRKGFAQKKNGLELFRLLYTPSCVVVLVQSIYIFDCMSCFHIRRTCGMAFQAIYIRIFELSLGRIRECVWRSLLCGLKGIKGYMDVRIHIIEEKFFFYTN